MSKRLVSLLLLALLAGGCSGDNNVCAERDKPRSLPFPHADL
ncbi:hypothetical protein [Microbulbifer thermotolerans]|uniref:Uncharacterized protein n=1 Tax=Microbulbifer thermotolerans TaxID=252514 RepID=A0AB35HTR5_MICTH|nr:hypothetical protein [Microbulbifer thermotolerans]MCX2778289.1 hypothetical protein [Microbulbifer thermotolerans]MCX2781988.1 hypothetical protein [Microbulbifer thermotolerans]MCX2783254.1 hypothetical protein [Microbulbifer thermotolerans]MCX2796306.1 hypothetical protein [Microbulbifer thermotolerans]MCX2800336.1 hypothetical protein [Microbulbifer thermotolerans]